MLSEKPRPKAWKDFFSSLSASEETEAFMAERPMNVAPRERGLFDEESK